MIAALGLVSLRWIVDTPEECGLLPDNLPLTRKERQAFGGTGRQDWRARELICSKDGLCYIVGFGLLFIATTGGITAFVPYMQERGYSQVDAVGLMSLTSLFSLVGSFAIGVLDTKLGTKKASLIFATLYVVGYSGAFALTGTERLFLLPLWLAMASGGANANLMASALVMPVRARQLCQRVVCTVHRCQPDSQFVLPVDRRHRLSVRDLCQSLSVLGRYFGVQLCAAGGIQFQIPPGAARLILWAKKRGPPGICRGDLFFISLHIGAGFQCSSTRISTVSPSER